MNCRCCCSYKKQSIEISWTGKWLLELVVVNDVDNQVDDDDVDREVILVLTVVDCGRNRTSKVARTIPNRIPISNKTSKQDSAHGVNLQQHFLRVK